MKSDTAAQIAAHIVDFESLSTLDERLNAFKYAYQSIMALVDVSAVIEEKKQVKGTTGPRKIPIISQADIAGRIQNPQPKE
jgi:hypothetical protein